MSQGVRLLYPDRGLVHYEVINLDTLLPPDHRARMVWDFVSGLDLSAFLSCIKARDEHPGRSASDPAALLALWLYATVEGIGSARAIERLCEDHAAYRWLCGGVPVNHNLLSEFRRDNGERIDALLTQSLTGLIAEGLVPLEEIANDGTKVRARAGHGSMVKAGRLARIEAAAKQRVASLKREVEQNPGGAERRQRERALRAAQERVKRIARARRRIGELEQEKTERAKRHAKEEEEKAAPKVSVSDPEVRLMRMPDGAVHPGWNVQVTTAGGFVVAIEATDRRKDSGLAAGMMEQVEQRCGRRPERLLSDATAITQDEIIRLAEPGSGVTVYSPLPEEKTDVTPGTLRNRRWKRNTEAQALKDWRKRMDSEEGREIYKRRKLTEHVHAKMKNRGFGRMPVHGLAGVQGVCLLHALAHNMLHAAHLRRVHAAA